MADSYRIDWLPSDLLTSDKVGDRQLKVQAQISSSSGTENFIFPFGEQLSASKRDDVSVQFQYNYLDEQFDVVLPTLTGDGARTVTNSVLRCSSASSGQAIVSSRDSIRYRAGHSGYIDFTLSANGTGSVRGGGFDILEQNGFVVEIVNGIMYFGYLKDGVKKGTAGANGFDSESVFNGNISPSLIDYTKLNIFRITFGYLGVASPTLWIKKGVWQRVHTVDTEGVLNDTHVSTPVFPITILAENGSTAESGSWNGGVIGTSGHIGARGFMFPNIMLQGVATEQGSVTLVGSTVTTLVLFRLKDTFQSKINNVKARLTDYAFSVDIPSGNVVGDVIFQIVGVQTLSGTPTFSDVNTNSSILEIDHVAGSGSSVSVTAGVPFVQEQVSYTGSSKGGITGSISVDAESIGAFGYRGDMFAVIAKDLGGNGVTVRPILNWEELF